MVRNEGPRVPLQLPGELITSACVHGTVIAQIASASCAALRGFISCFDGLSGIPCLMSMYSSLARSQHFVYLLEEDSLMCFSSSSLFVSFTLSRQFCFPPSFFFLFFFFFFPPFIFFFLLSFLSNKSQKEGKKQPGLDTWFPHTGIFRCD